MITEQTFGPLAEADSQQVVDAILAVQPRPHIITFSGDLGAGKTTLIRKLVKSLGSDDAVNSPTFGLVNEYRTAAGLLICHTDWYRIKDASELLDAGLTDYIHDDDCLMLIEWPDAGAILLQGETALHVHITHAGDFRIYRLAGRLS